MRRRSYMRGTPFRDLRGDIEPPWRDPPEYDFDDDDDLAYDWPTPYCTFCDTAGHLVGTCPQRDDDLLFEEE